MVVTRRGQVTIPIPIRRELGIEEGCEVRFQLVGSRIVIEKVPGSNPFRRWKGFLKRAGSSDELVRQMRGHAAGRS